MVKHPRIGIVGSAGAYGCWLRRFFESRMGLEVIGQDPADATSVGADALIAGADVLVFSVPIRHTPAVIERYVACAAGRDARQLWLDITSVKTAPVDAMLLSGAEVAGLHPMTAPPKTPTLKGRVLVVCEARLRRWKSWLHILLTALEAECVRTTPQRHDQVMALVQALAHAVHLAQAGVLHEQAASIGGVAALLPFRSGLFEMDVAIMARILSLNPAIYEDIQFGNPHTPDVLHALAERIERIAALVDEGSDRARATFRAEFLEQNRDAFAEPTLAEATYTFERLGYLLADLNDARTLSIYLPEDHPGSLRTLLQVFERHGVSIASLHSSRTAAGELHFRFGFGPGTRPAQLRKVARDVEDSEIGRVLP